MYSWYVRHRYMNGAILSLSLLALLSLLIYPFYIDTNSEQVVILISCSVITTILLLMNTKSFRVMYLTSTFMLIVAWRLAVLAKFELTAYVYLLAFILKVLSYVAFSYKSIKKAKEGSLDLYRATAFEWQLMFIRMFIGFDLIPHFCEKLFAGSVVRADDIQAFIHLGVPHAATMVFTAGMVELAGAISLGCGFMTRLGAVCLSIYLLVAAYLGSHFSIGFIWALPGGGWEYPVLWASLILTFSVFGAGDFSLDSALKHKYRLPSWLKHLMGGRFD